MQNKRGRQGTTYNWYQNLDSQTVVSRKVKTASGKRIRQRVKKEAESENNPAKDTEQVSFKL